MAKVWVVKLNDTNNYGEPVYEVYTDAETARKRTLDLEVGIGLSAELDPPLKRVWRVRGDFSTIPIVWMAEPWDAAYNGLDRVRVFGESTIYSFVKAKTETEAIGTVRILLQRMI